MVDYKNKLTETSSFLLENDNYLIVSHVQPDGDTISSSLAMAHLLNFLGKSFVLVNQDLISGKFSYLKLLDSIKGINLIDQRFDNVITIDVADKSRAGNIDSLVNNNAKILNIDHHPTNDHFGNINLILPSAAATAEIMYDLIEHMQAPITKDIAECIYTGLLTDTGGFRYSNTSSKVMRIAAELLEHNISPSDIAEIALETITIGHIELLTNALDRLEIIEDGLICLTTIKPEDFKNVKNNDDSEGIVNYTRNIEGVEVGILFKEAEKGIIKVSLRSKRHVDVGSLAKIFGGGGHARASGFTFIGNIEEIKEKILTEIKSSKGWNSLGK